MKSTFDDKKIYPVSAGRSAKPVKRKAKDKPKRPLSAYNYFFKEERENILNVVLNRSALSTNDPAFDEDIDAEFINKLEKNGGKVSFEEMGRLIGVRWKNISKERLTKYQSAAAADAERYKKEMQAYTTQQEAKLRKEAMVKQSAHQWNPRHEDMNYYHGQSQSGPSHHYPYPKSTMEPGGYPGYNGYNPSQPKYPPNHSMARPSPGYNHNPVPMNGHNSYGIDNPGYGYGEPGSPAYYHSNPNPYNSGYVPGNGESPGNIQDSYGNSKAVGNSSPDMGTGGTPGMPSYEHIGSGSPGYDGNPPSNYAPPNGGSINIPHKNNDGSAGYPGAQYYRDSGEGRYPQHSAPLQDSRPGISREGQMKRQSNTDGYNHYPNHPHERHTNAQNGGGYWYQDNYPPKESYGGQNRW